MLLKVKPTLDAEGTVIGFVSGSQGETGKMLGLIGGIMLRFNNGKDTVEFELGVGLDMSDRNFADEKSTKIAADNPDKRMPEGTQGEKFKLGDSINFIYRELTEAGIPKEARFNYVRTYN
jgi:hypothetical protein